MTLKNHRAYPSKAGAALPDSKIAGLKTGHYPRAWARRLLVLLALGLPVLVPPLGRVAR